jgi:hypothetical protein
MTSGLKVVHWCQPKAPVASRVRRLSPLGPSWQRRRAEEVRGGEGKERKWRGLGSFGPRRGAEGGKEGEEEAEVTEEEEEIEVEASLPWAFWDGKGRGGMEVPAPGRTLAMGQVRSEICGSNLRVGWGERKSWGGVWPKSRICVSVAA